MTEENKDLSKLTRDILSDIVVHMKYAKYIPELKRRENWYELVYRNRQMHIDKFPELEEEIREAYQYVFDKKVFPSMRSLQFGGKPIEINPTRIYNCCFIAADSWHVFHEALFCLLSGTGVGVSVQYHHVEQLPEIKKPNKKRNKRFLIGDSLEGWADAVKALVKSYFFGGSKINFDFSDIRPKGAKLITSGGKAPGPAPLKECLVQIESILDSKNDGDKLSTLEVHDIICYLADATLAGGIRRAAVISLFSIDDNEMGTCKSGNWWETNPQRGRANNSAVVLRSRVTKEDFDNLFEKSKASGAGEPGIFFTNDRDAGTNPCCISGDTLISTSKGKIPVKNLIGRPFFATVSGRDHFSNAGFWCTGRKSVFQLTLTNGYSVKLTADHLVETENRGWKRADELNEDDGIYVDTDIGYDNCSNLYSMKYVGEEEVYDVNIPAVSKFCGNGISLHNCEISLKSMQFCNLCEVNVSDVQNQEDYEQRTKAAAFIGTLQASYTNFHYLREQWRKNSEKDALLGVGMVGIASEKVLRMDMKKAAQIAKDENERVAKLIGINKAARITTCKPGGSVSLVAGTSSGIHAWHNEHYIRRIRVGKNEAIYTYLKENHPELIEDEFFRPHDTAVISVPVKAPENSITRKESAIDFLERVKKVYLEWVKAGHNSGTNTHNVSATISIKPREWNDVQKWMWENRDCYSGLSLLPHFESDHTYKQPPFSDISEEEFAVLASRLSEIDLDYVVESEDNTDLKGELACSGGNCTIT